MDEPLSNSDAKIRVQMRAEIAKLHHRLKTTTSFETHDQTEAITTPSRLVVMKEKIPTKSTKKSTSTLLVDALF